MVTGRSFFGALPVHAAPPSLRTEAKVMQHALRTTTCSLALLASAALMSSQALALTINPIFADSYTGPNFGFPVVSLDGNVAAENAIVSATQLIASQYSNNVTVNVLYYGSHDTTGGFLGAR